MNSNKHHSAHKETMSYKSRLKKKIKILESTIAELHEITKMNQKVSSLLYKQLDLLLQANMPKEFGGTLKHLPFPSRYDSSKAVKNRDDHLKLYKVDEESASYTEEEE